MNIYKSLGFLLALVSLNMGAQKPALSTDDLSGWKHIAKTQISPKGEVFSYEILPQEGDGKLVFVKGKKNVEIERGTSVILSSDGKYAWFKIKPKFEEVRAAKIAKKRKSKMPQDSLGFINLRNFEIKKYPNLKSFSAGAKKQPYCAYMTTYNNGKYKAMVVLDPMSNDVDTVKHVSSFVFSENGERIAAVRTGNKSGKRSNALLLYTPSTHNSEIITKGKKFYASPSFSSDGRSLVFLASNDENKTGDKHCSLMFYDGQKCEELLEQGYCKGLPGGWTLNQNSSPVISLDNNKVILGVAPCLPPDDDTIVDFETAKLDVWRWNSILTPPEEIFYLNELKKKTYKAVLNLNNPKDLVLLTEVHNDNIILLDQGCQDWALSIDREPYMISETWAFHQDKDLALVNLKDGSRKEIKKGLSGFVKVSPQGKYILWFDLDKGHFYSYRVSDGNVICLTDKLGVNFFDEENDRPHSPFPYSMNPVISENDDFVIVSDRYDLWQINLDGKSTINLTNGYGRANHLRFRYIDLVGENKSALEKALNKQNSVSKKGEAYITVFDENDMRNGLGRIELQKSANPKFFIDTMSFVNLVKAEKSDEILYQKGNFEVSYDLYLTDNNWKTSERLTNVNPQQNDYRWGNAKLVHWTAYDGTPLKGVLFLPEGLDKNKKYPMVSYFYERKSQTLYDYLEPSPSRSRVNVPYFCSNGYIVFMPDIVYEIGHPGNSGYNCIVSGVEAMCKEYSFIDKDNLALQGQSWGGYQTTYIITKTDMFKAAGAGAPVSNMTSAYGGIRWENGIVRTWQYEHDQSRIGCSLWDEGGLDLYIENSPLFFADKINTPLLITANDADGAVPWYQGIELYSAMRRLNKPMWMLQYNDELHNLKYRRNRIDLTKRMMQFFDHYLKGKPMPAWMKNGVPTVSKGRYFGFEYVN